MVKDETNGTLAREAQKLYTKCIWYDYCPIPEFVLSGKISTRWLNQYCHHTDPECRRYQLENYGHSMPDNLLPDGRIDRMLHRFDD